MHAHPHASDPARRGSPARVRGRPRRRETSGQPRTPYRIPGLGFLARRRPGGEGVGRHASIECGAPQRAAEGSVEPAVDLPQRTLVAAFGDRRGIWIRRRVGDAGHASRRQAQKPRDHGWHDVDVDGVEHQALAWDREIRAETGAAAFRKGEAEHRAALRYLLLFQDDLWPSIAQCAGDVLETQVPCVARSRSGSPRGTLFEPDRALRGPMREYQVPGRRTQPRWPKRCSNVSSAVMKTVSNASAVAA